MALDISGTVPGLVGLVLAYYDFARQLRHQHRIRLHLCLMLSSLVNSFAMLLWEVIIFRDRLYNVDSQSRTVMDTNSVGCRILNVATRYSLMSNFMWMFNEGFHLHRLLVHAFTTTKSLIPYYLVGFALPCVPTIAYVIIRGVDDNLNTKCWVEQAGHWEWILYTPILLVLLANVFFLFRIVFIMTRQLEPHPNEPSHFRRAARAVGVLVPLFGVQFILFIYRPEGGQYADVFELCNKVVSSLQGAFVAIVFCYCNTEVQTHLRSVFLRLVRSRRGPMRESSLRGNSFTVSTQYQNDNHKMDSTRRNGDNGVMIHLNQHFTSPQDDVL